MMKRRTHTHKINKENERKRTDSNEMSEVHQMFKERMRNYSLRRTNPSQNAFKRIDSSGCPYTVRYLPHRQEKGITVEVNVSGVAITFEKFLQI